MTNWQPNHPWDNAVAIEADAARCWILDHIRSGASRGVALSDCLGLGLPGSPASAFVSYHLCARAVLDRLAGDSLGGARRSFEAAATVDLPRRCDGRSHVVPMIAEAVAGQLVVSPAATADRHHLASTAAANAYAYLPDGPGARAGELVDCSWIEPR